MYGTQRCQGLTCHSPCGVCANMCCCYCRGLVAGSGPAPLAGPGADMLGGSAAARAMRGGSGATVLGPRGGRHRPGRQAPVIGAASADARQRTLLSGGNATMFG